LGCRTAGIARWAAAPLKSEGRMIPGVGQRFQMIGVPADLPYFRVCLKMM
jgi:hypothetical protein